MQSSVPGPRQLPVIGSIVEFRKRPLQFLMELTARYGDIVRFRLGPEEILLLSAPEHLQHVFQDNYKNYGKQSRVWHKMEPLLGRGLVTSEGEDWLRQRRTTQPSFHRDRIATFAAPIGRATESMLNGWQGRAADGEPIESVSELMHLALAILGDTLFGADLHGDAETLHEVVTRILMRVNQQTRTILYFLPSWLPTPGNLAFKRAVGALDAIVDRLIAESLRHPDGSLIGSLHRATDSETGQRFGASLLRDQVKSFLFAGHETTAIGMAWTLYLLAKHPAEAARVRQELDLALGANPPTLADLPRLGHLERFIQETLRLYPPVWFLGRNAIGPDRLGRYPIPPGTLVMPTPYVAHHRPDTWAHAEDFDPDRFLPERFGAMPRFAYVPFGGGPRQCIGNHFAMMEMMLVVARIVQRFELQLVPDHPVDIDAGITLRPKAGLPLRVSLRRASGDRLRHQTG